MSSNLLSGLRILLVEDDPIIALDLAENLRLAGADVVGPAHTVGKGLELVGNQSIDVAVLDWRLERETALPVAAVLVTKSVPFLFHTSTRGDPELAYPQVRILDKPTRPEHLVAEIRALTGRG